MGIKGYKHPGKKRMVVAVNPDGSVAEVFEYIKDAVAKYGMDRHSITNSCKRGTICHGWKWFYEEDFRRIYMACEYEKLRFTLDPNRDPVTYHFRKGHKLNAHARRSPETKKRCAEISRRNCLRRKETGGYDESKKKMWKPVICVDDGLEFPSIGHAAEHYGIPRHYISGAVHRVGKTGGKKFRLKSQWEKIMGIARAVCPNN